MPTPIKYIIDTSSLTQAYRTYYSFDIAPSFWSFLASQFTNAGLASIDKVYEELKLGKDALYGWLAAPNLKGLLIDTKSDADILAHYIHLMQWADAQSQYKQLAKERFAAFENADPWIIATAMAHQATVVSMEVSAPAAQSAIKIPDVCAAMGIRHIDSFSFLQETGFSM